MFCFAFALLCGRASREMNGRARPPPDRQDCRRLVWRRAGGQTGGRADGRTGGQKGAWAAGQADGQGGGRADGRVGGRGDGLLTLTSCSRRHAKPLPTRATPGNFCAYKVPDALDTD